MSKKKKSAWSAFLGGFLKTVLVLVLMAAVGFGSYHGVYWYCEKNNGGKIKERVDKIRKEQREPETIYTAIILDDTMNSGLENIMLKVFNTGTKNTDYVMMPTNSCLDSTSRVYQQIKAQNSSLNSTITIGEIGSYISNEKKRCEMVVQALEELCGIEEIAYYETYNQKVLVSIANLVQMPSINVPIAMTTKDTSGFELSLRQGMQTLNGEQIYGLLCFNGYPEGGVDQAKVAATYWSTYYKVVGAFDEESKKSFYDQYYKLVVSNDTESLVSNYVSDFMETTKTQYQFHLAEGMTTTEGFVLNTNSLKSLITEIAAEQEAYTIVQDMSAFEIEVQSSKDLVIDIYNSTVVSGLAGKWRDTLTAYGYQINRVDTDRTGTKEHAMIYVKETGRGLDLKAYFPQAEFITDPMLEEADIRIVLGTAEAQS